MVLHFRNFQTVIKINEPFLKLQCNFLIHLFGVWKYDVNVICLDDKVVQRLNKRYRGVDAPTDVLSFSYHEAIRPDKLPTVENEWDYNLGDLILGMREIHRGCVADKVEMQHRLPVLVTHGLCHLLGYDHEHKEDCELMYSKEKSILLQFNRTFGMKLCPLTKGVM